MWNHFLGLTIDNILRDISAKQDFYLDPGTGNFLIQLLIALSVGSLFLIRSSWSRIKKFLRKLSGKEEISQPDDKNDDG